MNTVNRTNLTAFTARDTLLVVDNGEIVNHVDSIHRTGLLTLAAGDTSVKTELADNGALVMVRALDNHSLGVSDKVNNSVGTGAYTKSAANALSLVNHRNSTL